MWPELSFHTRVLVEVVLLAGLSAFLGPHILDRRLAFFTHTLGHATFPGITLAAILGVNLAIGGFLGASAAVMALGLLTRRAPRRVSASTGLLLAAGFAIGVGLTSAFLNNTARDLETFLVGQIVNVTSTDLLITLGLLVVTILVTTVWHGRFVASAFDPEGDRAHGNRPAAATTALLTLLAACAATVAAQVGSILAVAFLIAAPNAARALIQDRALAVLLGWLLAAGAGLLGATLSEHANLATGPTIAVALGALTVLTTTGSALKTKLRARSRARLALRETVT